MMVPEVDNSKFAAIWIIIILFNILMGVLLFVSFLACMIKNNSDYAWRNKYNIDDDYKDDTRAVDVGKVNVDTNFGGNDGQSEAGSDESYMTKAKSKRGAKSRVSQSEKSVMRTLNRSSR